MRYPLFILTCFVLMVLGLLAMAPEAKAQSFRSRSVVVQRAPVVQRQIVVNRQPRQQFRQRQVVIQQVSPFHQQAFRQSFVQQHAFRQQAIRVDQFGRALNVHGFHSQPLFVQPFRVQQFAVPCH